MHYMDGNTEIQKLLNQSYKDLIMPLVIKNTTRTINMSYNALR